jgi:hypothetical protein
VIVHLDIECISECVEDGCSKFLRRSLDRPLPQRKTKKLICYTLYAKCALDILFDNLAICNKLTLPNASKEHGGTPYSIS